MADPVRSKVSKTSRMAACTSAPQPVVVKLFSRDPDEIASWAPKVADALDRIQINYKKPVVDIEDGIENTTSGPALVFNINPAAAAKA